MEAVILDFYEKYPEHFDILINALLVQNGIRKAFLIQHDESSIRERETKWMDKSSLGMRILTELKGLFPTFYYTLIGQGILISKQSLPFDPENYTEQQLGEILSYPCPGDVDRMRKYTVNYNIIFHGKLYGLFGSICDQISGSVGILAEKIDDFIKRLNQYLSESDKIGFEYSFSPIYNIDDAIQLLVNNDLNDSVKNLIMEKFYGNDLVLIEILHNDGIIDIFDPKYRQLLLILLSQIQPYDIIGGKITDELDLISDLNTRVNLAKIRLNNRQQGLVNILNNLYGINIDVKKYMAEVYHAYNL